MVFTKTLFPTQLLLALPLVFIACGAFAETGRAAEVRVSLSSDTTSVALPVELSVVIQNAADAELPKIPRVPGLSIESLGPPQIRSSRTIINGRASEFRAEIYSFRVTPQRPGTFKIPKLNLLIDGEKITTESLTLEVEPIEESDFLILEIEGQKESVYVGQALEITLKIWIKPFESKKFDVQVAAESMWRMLSDSSKWGPFEDAVKDLYERRRLPKAEEFLRVGKDGKSSTYYLFELETTIYPKRSGPIEMDEVSIIMNYPVELRRDSPSSMLGGFPFGRDPFEDFFSSRNSLRIGRTKPTIAQASLEQVDVKPIPTNGMPADYRGAVGEYTIRAAADPTRVKAGEPITLQMAIEGSGPLELVQAPPLAELDTFSGDFKVADQNLAGIVQDGIKYFTTKIRPLNSELKEIPAIPLSYFDPEKEEFVTVMSDPIRIEVTEGQTLNLDDVVSSKKASNNLPADANPTSSPERLYPGNSSDAQILESQSKNLALGWQHIALLVAPPMLSLICILGMRRKHFTGSLAQLKSPLNQAISKSRKAERSEDILDAIIEFLTRRLYISRDSKPLAVVGELRQLGHEGLAVEFERLFESLGSNQSWATDDAIDESLKETSIKLIQKTNTELGSRKKRRFVKNRSMLALLLAFSFSSAAIGIEATKEETPKYGELELSQILADADKTYRLSLKSEEVEARSALAESAAQKYQLLINQGIHNAQLYLNTANAYFASEQYGRAIAHYRQALRINPSDAEAFRMLNRSREAIASSEEDAAMDWNGQFRSILQWCWTLISPLTCGWIALLSWCGLWAIPVAIAWKGRRPGLIPCGITLCLLSLTFGGLFLTAQRDAARDDIAVLVNESIEVRAGDDKNFPISATLDNAEGREVIIQSQRGNWLLIKSDALSKPGWIQQTNAVVLK